MSVDLFDLIGRFIDWLTGLSFFFSGEEKSSYPKREISEVTPGKMTPTIAPSVPASKPATSPLPHAPRPKSDTLEKEFWETL